MSDTTEVIKSTIEKVLERVDILADKLGVTAKEIWRFSLTAKMVDARRDLWKSALFALVALPFLGWGVHIATTPIPHDIEHRDARESRYGYLVDLVDTPPCRPPEIKVSDNKVVTKVVIDGRECREYSSIPSQYLACLEDSGAQQHCNHSGNTPATDTATDTDTGISSFGIFLIVSGVVAFLVALVILITSISGVVDAIADSKTVEYDAYQDIIYDWKN